MFWVQVKAVCMMRKKNAMDKFYGSDKYHMFYWTQESEIEDFINKQSKNKTIFFLTNSYKNVKKIDGAY